MFDMDGLLVDSEPLWFQAEGAVMARLGGSWLRRRPARAGRRFYGDDCQYLLSKGTGTAEPAAVAAG